MIKWIKVIFTMFYRTDGYINWITLRWYWDCGDLSKEFVLHILDVSHAHF